MATTLRRVNGQRPNHFCPSPLGNVGNLCPVAVYWSSLYLERSEVEELPV